jgi:hypothetical protein
MRRAAGSFKTAANGAYLHRLTESDSQTFKRPPVTPAPVREEIPLAEIERRDTVYSALIRDCLTLRLGHRNELMRRGLSNEAINRAGYISAPNLQESDEAAQRLASYDLRGVPGFYCESGKWRMVTPATGFYIPVRDERGRIEGFQVRPDVAHGAKYFWLSSVNKEGGASSGAPVHFAQPHLLQGAREVLVTEGALKANVIAHLAHLPVVAIAGVSTFGANFGARLRAEFPNLHEAVIAFDRDMMEKQPVRAALERLGANLSAARFRVRVRMWDSPAKGFDDYLLEQARASREVAA